MDTPSHLLSHDAGEREPNSFIHRRNILENLITVGRMLTYFFVLFFGKFGRFVQHNRINLGISDIMQRVLQRQPASNLSAGAPPIVPAYRRKGHIARHCDTDNHGDWSCEE